MNKGDIVLITFPFTDLTGSKLRPALVLAATKDEVTVVFVTTQLKWMSTSDVIVLPDAQNGIKKQSLIRISKIATLDRALAFGKLGVLDPSKMLEVESKLKQYLQIL